MDKLISFYEKNEQLIFESTNSFKGIASLTCNPLCDCFSGCCGALLTVLHTMLLADRSFSRYCTQWKKDASPKVTPSYPRAALIQYLVSAGCKGGLVSLLQGGTTWKGHPAPELLMGMIDCGISVQFCPLPNPAYLTSQIVEPVSTLQ